MNNRIVLLALSVLAIGIFALPNTLSIFSGQHTFYNGTNVNCRDCHEDIYQELTWNGATGESPPHTSTDLLQCKVCHRTGQLPFMGSAGKKLGITGTKKLNITTDPQAHAAVTVECIFCHNEIVKNSSTGKQQELLGSQEAHGSYYNASNQTSLLKGGNEACLGCHSHTMINATWVRSTGYNMNVDLTQTSMNLSFLLNQTTTNSTSAGE
jgi:hypothetical protein